MLEITHENFEAEVLKANKPVLVDFWAPWCGPCQMMGPFVEEFANTREDVIVAKLNVDDAPALAQQYGIMSIPTVLLFTNGEEVGRKVGLIGKADLDFIVYMAARKAERNADSET